MDAWVWHGMYECYSQLSTAVYFFKCMAWALPGWKIIISSTRCSRSPKKYNCQKCGICTNPSDLWSQFSVTCLKKEQLPQILVFFGCVCLLKVSMIKTKTAKNKKPPKLSLCINNFTKMPDKFTRVSLWGSQYGQEMLRQKKQSQPFDHKKKLFVSRGATHPTSRFIRGPSWFWNMKDAVIAYTASGALNCGTRGLDAFLIGWLQ